MSSFYVKTEADVAAKGPFTSAQLRALAARGKIKPNYLVSKDGRTWYVAEKISDLALSSDCPTAGSESSAVPQETGYEPVLPRDAIESLPDKLTRMKRSLIKEYYWPIDESFVALCRESFASEMADTETPVLLIGLEKQGFTALVTDRRLYAQTLEAPIPLDHVLAVHIERETGVEAFLRCISWKREGGIDPVSSLHVNGYCIHMTWLRLYHSCWREILTSLATACRESGHSHVKGALRPRPYAHDALLLAAGLICADKSEEEALADLSYAGLADEVARDEVTSLIMARQRLAMRRKREKGAIFALVVGLGGSVLSIGALLESIIKKGSDSDFERIVTFCLVGVFALMFLVAGLKGIFGKPPVRIEKLLDSLGESE